MAAAGSLAFGAGALVVTAVFDARFRSAGRDEFRQFVGVDLAWLAGWVASAAVGAILLLRRPRTSDRLVVLRVGGDDRRRGRVRGVWALRPARPARVAARGSGSRRLPRTRSSSSAFMLLALVCSLTPDGQYLSDRWRRASHVMIGASMVWIGLRLIGSEPPGGAVRFGREPLGGHIGRPGLRHLVAATLSNTLVLAAAISLVVRFRRTKGDARRQMLWIADRGRAGPCADCDRVRGRVHGSGRAPQPCGRGAGRARSVGVGLAVTRYHLYDVERILSRAVTYLIVTGLLVGTYLALVFVVARLVGQAADRSPTATTVATLIAVAAARPVYGSVRDTLDRRFQRRRYEALNQVPGLRCRSQPGPGRRGGSPARPRRPHLARRVPGRETELVG